jgi:hypothetical protein
MSLDAAGSTGLAQYLHQAGNLTTNMKLENRSGVIAAQMDVGAVYDDGGLNYGSGQLNDIPRQ